MACYEGDEYFVDMQRVLRFHFGAQGGDEVLEGTVGGGEGVVHCCIVMEVVSVEESEEEVGFESLEELRYRQSRRYYVVLSVKPLLPEVQIQSTPRARVLVTGHGFANRIYRDGTSTITLVIVDEKIYEI